MQYGSTIWELLRDLEAIFDAFQRLNCEGEVKARTVECAFTTLMLHRRSRLRADARTLMQIMEDVRRLDEFRGVDEQSLILSLLAVVFDAELLVHTKEMLSQAFTKQNLLNSHPQTAKPTDADGLSLVLHLELPGILQSALDRFLEPIGEHLSLTPIPHITLVNLAVQLQPGDVERVRSLFSDRLENSLAEDANLNHLCRSVTHSAGIRSELRIMPKDGALVLFGSGRRFLAMVHRLRLMLISKFVTAPDMMSAFQRAASPVWYHFVHSRISERVPEADAELLGDWPPQGLPEKIPLTNLRIGLMTFKGKSPLDIWDVSL